MLDAAKNQTPDSYIAELEDMLADFYQQSFVYPGTHYEKCMICNWPHGHRSSGCAVVTMESEFPNIVKSTVEDRQ